MLSGISTIYLHTELLFPQIPALAIQKNQIRDLYNALQKPGYAAYENLDLQADFPALSTRHEGGHSRCQIGGGKIRIEEDNSRAGIDDFIAVVKGVLTCLGPNVAPFYAQRCMIRCTAQPNAYDNSLLLLAGRVANVFEPVAPFGRPPAYFGVRFRFPPIIRGEAKSPENEGGAVVEGEKGPGERTASKRAKKAKKAAETPRDDFLHKGHFTLRFETYSEDPKKVWMELAAEYLEEMITTADQEVVGRNIQSTYQFLTDNAKRFLDQFDTPKDGEKDGKGE